MTDDTCGYVEDRMPARQLAGKECRRKWFGAECSVAVCSLLTFAKTPLESSRSEARFTARKFLQKFCVLGKREIKVFCDPMDSGRSWVGRATRFQVSTSG